MEFDLFEMHLKYELFHKFFYVLHLSLIHLSGGRSSEKSCRFLMVAPDVTMEHLHHSTRSLGQF